MLLDSRDTLLDSNKIVLDSSKHSRGFKINASSIQWDGPPLSMGASPPTFCQGLSGPRGPRALLSFWGRSGRSPPQKPLVPMGFGEGNVCFDTNTLSKTRSQISKGDPDSVAIVAQAFQLSHALPLRPLSQLTQVCCCSSRTSY